MGYKVLEIDNDDAEAPTKNTKCELCDVSVSKKNYATHCKTKNHKIKALEANGKVEAPKKGRPKKEESESESEEEVEEPVVKEVEPVEQEPEIDESEWSSYFDQLNYTEPKDNDLSDRLDAITKHLERLDKINNGDYSAKPKTKKPKAKVITKVVKETKEAKPVKAEIKPKKDDLKDFLSKF